MKKAKQQCKVPFRNSYLSARLQPASKGHQPELGSQPALSFMALVLFCYCNVFKFVSRLVEWGRKSWREDLELPQCEISIFGCECLVINLIQIVPVRLAARIITPQTATMPVAVSVINISS